MKLINFLLDHALIIVLGTLVLYSFYYHLAK
jgi:hypothetical protein